MFKPLVFDDVLDGTIHTVFSDKHYHIPTGVVPIRSSHDEHEEASRHTHTEYIWNRRVT